MTDFADLIAQSDAGAFRCGRLLFEAHIDLGDLLDSTARRATVVRRDDGYVAAFDGGRVPLSATYRTVEWLLRQPCFRRGMHSLCRRAPILAALRAVLDHLRAPGLLVAAEMH